MSTPEFEVGGKTFHPVKTGIDQAEQVLALAKWLGKHGAVLGSVAVEAEDEAEVTNMGLLMRIVDKLTAQALVELFAVVVGCTEKFAMQHFDVAILIDALMLNYDQSPAVRRLIERFFSGEASAQAEATENSTS